MMLQVHRLYNELLHSGSETTCPDTLNYSPSIGHMCPVNEDSAYSNNDETNSIFEWLKQFDMALEQRIADATHYLTRQAASMQLHRVVSAVQSRASGTYKSAVAALPSLPIKVKHSLSHEHQLTREHQHWRAHSVIT